MYRVAAAALAVLWITARLRQRAGRGLALDILGCGPAL
jgi:hypothetical protein